MKRSCGSDRRYGSARTIPLSASGIRSLGWRIYCNHGPTRRSSGWRDRAARVQTAHLFTRGSPLPMASRARVSGPPPSLLKPGGNRRCPKRDFEKGATLFCTTFPCHMCARLIIASGVKAVVLIEPYPKSKTHDLYSDSVEV